MYRNTYVKITCRLEESDHDGYCSGNECKYYDSIKEFDFCVGAIALDLYNKYKDHPEGVLEEFDEDEWKDILPFPEERDCCQSGYCDNGEECEEKGLSKHEHRYTILEIKFYDMKRNEESK